MSEEVGGHSGVPKNKRPEIPKDLGIVMTTHEGKAYADQLEHLINRVRMTKIQIEFDNVAINLAKVRIAEEKEKFKRSSKV